MANKLQQAFAAKVQPESSFDLVEKRLNVGPVDGWIYFVDGFAKDEVMEKVMEFWMKMTPELYGSIQTPADFCKLAMPYIESTPAANLEQAVTFLLSGALVLVVEGIDGYLIIDARTYPVRSLEEPENERVLRGAREGFVETLIFNTALLRRRVRDPELKVELFQLGNSSKTDIALCYHGNRADVKLIGLLQKKLKNLNVDALPMSQESLAEQLFKPKWYNPFPKVRYTERPDAAAAHLLEGRVILMVDNSPMAMVLPTGFLDFLQEADDYYFPVLTGSYLRILRLGIYLVALFLTPLYLLLIRHPEQVPQWLEFIIPTKEANLPPIVQLLLLEAAVDGIKLASLSTPSGLGNSLSIIGGLLLGEYAVQAGWFSSEIILYMAFVALANFAQPNYEMGYALKFMRVMLLIATALFGIWGFIGGCVVICVLLACNRTVAGKSYLYPLIPFNGRRLIELLLRMPGRNVKAGFGPNAPGKPAHKATKKS